jgi:tetratricopeptide (TPR) repeat protein
MVRSRDDFSVRVQEELAKRAGYSCSLCGNPTIGPKEAERGFRSDGIAAHITGAAPHGPRYDPLLTSAYRKDFENGIWLCTQCARRVDADEAAFPVQRLRSLKSSAELKAKAANERSIRSASRIDVAGLFPTGCDLYGRDSLLAELDQANAMHGVRVVWLWGTGGVGKTAVAYNWLLSRKTILPSIFGWTFPNQAQGGEAETDSSRLLKELWRFLEIQSEMPPSAYTVSLCLADALRTRPAILLFDGIEALQFGTGVHFAEFRDKAMYVLLRNLAFDNPGLCICTSLLPPPESEGRGYFTRQVSGLPDDAAIQYLRSRGLKGTDPELRALVSQVGGSPLFLSLIAGSVPTQGLTVSSRGGINPWDSGEPFSWQASKIATVYRGLFEGTAEGTLLDLLATLDRPVEREFVEHVWPLIRERDPSISTQLKQLRHAVSRLAHLGLLLSTAKPGYYDCHALIRAAVRKELAERSPADWQRMNEQISKQLLGQLEHLPDSVEDCDRICEAVKHSNRAGKRSRALKIYKEVLLRGSEYHLWKRLGLFSMNLACLAQFFDHDWSAPLHDLSNDQREWLLGQTGITLSALARLEEAELCCRSAATLSASRLRRATSLRRANTPTRALVAAEQHGALSQVLLHRGNVWDAIASGRSAVKYADESGDPFRRVYNRCLLAEALHAHGECALALSDFSEAEKLFVADGEHVYLDSIKGYLYQDLLLDLGKREEVLQRSEINLARGDRLDSLLAEGYQLLSLARARGLESIESEVPLRNAIARFRRYGDSVNLQVALRYELEWLLQRGNTVERDAVVEEYLHLSMVSGARLRYVDLLIIKARIAALRASWGGARKILDEARDSILQCGYIRVLPMVDQLTIHIEERFQECN